MINLINPRYSGDVYTAMAVTGAAAAAMFTRFEAIKIVGLTILTAVNFGVANNMIACRDCIEYFTITHLYNLKDLDCRYVRTSDPDLNALVWGMVTNWRTGVSAGVILSAIARVPFPRLSSQITARQLAPYMAIGAALSMLVAHIKSLSAQLAMAKKPVNKHYSIPLEFQSGWEGCRVRNLVGYTGLNVGGIALIIAMIASRTGLIKL